MKYISIFLLFLTSACSTNYYQSVADNNHAYVSFANLSQEIPEISIITNCKRSRIDPERIKYRKPSENADSLLEIPSDQPVSFVYAYAWFEGEEFQLVDRGYAQQNTQISLLTQRKASKGVKSCSEKITFVPEPEQKYEVYFGKNPRSCVISVSEAFVEPGNQKKHLMKVKSMEPPEC